MQSSDKLFKQKNIACFFVMAGHSVYSFATKWWSGRDFLISFPTK